MSKPVSPSTGENPADDDELGTIMKMLSCLDMTAEKAEKLVNFITTVTDCRLVAGESSDSEAGSLEPSSPSVEVAATPLDPSSPPIDITSQPTTSSVSPSESIQTVDTTAVSPGESLDDSELTTSSKSVVTASKDSEAHLAGAPPSEVAVAEPFNPMGPVHLLGVPGMYLESHNGFVYELPEHGTTGPFYLVTRGRRVGVFSGWQSTSPYVIGVSRASFSKVPSVHEGLTRLVSCIENDLARWID